MRHIIIRVLQIGPSAMITALLTMSALAQTPKVAHQSSIIKHDLGSLDWPQWRGPNRNGVWLESDVVEKFDGSQLPLRWRVPVSSGYSGPTVADGRVYLTDRVVKPQQIERVLCFDWKTGEEIWSFPYDCEYKDVGYTAGPRAAVTVYDGLAYALGTMGHLHCFDAASGALKWKRDLNAEYAIRMPIWGIASAPLVEGDLLIVHIGGSPDACIVAFDRKTGEEKWSALNDRASYAAPIVIEQAGKRVLVCWTGDNVVGLNPQSGALYWRYSFPPSREVIAIATPVFYKSQLFVSSFYDGSLMLKVEPDRLAVKEIWRRKGPSEQETDSLHSLISTPILTGDYVYGADSYGQLRCLDASTGDRIWEDLSAVPMARWSTIHSVRNDDKVWMFNERGELLITTLSPKGLNIISRAQLIEPTRNQLNRRGGVCWAHPAFAYKHVFARNDKELVCASLEK